MQLSITGPRNERRLAIRPYSGSLTYSFHTAGSAVATVTAPRAGDYLVRVPGVGAPGLYEIAIGESVGGQIVAAIGGAFAIGGVFEIAGVALLVVTGVRRSRRRAAAARREP